MFQKSAKRKIAIGQDIDVLVKLDTLRTDNWELVKR